MANMQENFEKLESRVFDCLNKTDLEKIYYELRKIDKPTVVTGVGGSSVVATYTSKIISKKNNIITKNVEPRDLLYMNIHTYDNVLSCSYSGNNYGVEVAFLNDLNHYLLSSIENQRKDITNLTYKCFDEEKSFISLAATLIPCSIMLNYYLNDDSYRIIDSIDKWEFNFDTNCDVYEIFTGYETILASKYLESTMTESGIGIPIVHDKYAYCHGRSTISKENNNIAIYFNLDTELDKLMLKELPKYYKNIIVLNTNNSLSDEYKLLIKCMYLTKYIAESNNKDLSKVEYSPIVKKLYKYNGKM